MADYQDVVKRIEKLGNVFSLDIIGDCDGFDDGPVHPYRLIARKKGGKRKRNVLISGGIHGTEPAGVYSVLGFLEKRVNRYLDDFSFFAYPCINPWGFETEDYPNYCGDDINDGFYQRSAVKEVKLVRNCLLNDGADYLFTMDFHETSCTCVFEVCRSKEDFLGDQIVQALGKRGIFNACNKDIDSAFRCFDEYLYRHYTNHAFTVESNLEKSLKSRVKTHILALETVLDEYAKKPL